MRTDWFTLLCWQLQHSSLLSRKKQKESEILCVSKATVSEAISELNEEGLIRKKKKANTYLIEPGKKEILERQ